MRRIRKIKKLKYSHSVRARLLKLNYVLNNRTLRKKTNKKKTLNYGLMRVGGTFFRDFNSFLKPSLYFTHFTSNSIAANVYPSLTVPKTTTAYPKYFFHLEGIFEAYGNITKFLLPKFFFKNVPGLRFLLFSNSYSFFKDSTSLEVKKIFYRKNYLLVNSLFDSVNYNLSHQVYSKGKLLAFISVKSLISLFFC